MNVKRVASSRRKGILYALGAAVLFGASTPFIRPAVEATGAAASAGYLYLGQALLLSTLWLAQRLRGRSSEAPLDRRDLLPLVAGIVAGGLLAPGAFTAGLARVPAYQVSLLLGLESVFTLMIALVFRRERLSSRAWSGVVLLLAAGIVVSLPAALEASGAGGANAAGALPGGAATPGGLPVGTALASTVLGTLLIVLACAGWAVDNNVTAGISGKDPTVITFLKGWVAATGYLGICLLSGITIVARPADIVTLLVAGGIGYGLALRLFVLALRHLGAALTTTLFSTAPLAGFAASVILLGEKPMLAGWVAFLMAGLGVAVVTTGVHEHMHTHDPMTHEHAHVHDVHHDHDHEEGVPVVDGHTHRHTHRALTHRHPHDSDIHHTHEH